MLHITHRVRHPVKYFLSSLEFSAEVGRLLLQLGTDGKLFRGETMVVAVHRIMNSDSSVSFKCNPLGCTFCCFTPGMLTHHFLLYCVNQPNEPPGAQMSLANSLRGEWTCKP